MYWQCSSFIQFIITPIMLKCMKLAFVKYKRIECQQFHMVRPICIIRNHVPFHMVQCVYQHHSTSALLAFQARQFFFWEDVLCIQYVQQHPWPLNDSIHPLPSCNKQMSPDIVNCSPGGQNHPLLRTTPMRVYVLIFY